MPPDPRRVGELSRAALDLPDPADRPAFLDRECGDDEELRRRLDELLAAHEQPRPDLGATAAPDDPGRTRDEPGGSEGPTADFVLEDPPPAPARGGRLPAGT